MTPNLIRTFMHCRKCMEQLPPDTSPRMYAHYEVGWTPKGLQVWCVRHETNIAALDFLGQKVGIESGHAPEPKGKKGTKL
jgi:hypothetical protein